MSCVDKVIIVVISRVEITRRVEKKNRLYNIHRSTD